jgi:ABC-2 type transport system ATP-binding protein
VLEALSLAEKANAQTAALSGGMKRRLLIAKALVHRPKLVFLDEPTPAWTWSSAVTSGRTSVDSGARGPTVILTTHYLEEAEELADRVGIINSGRLLLVEDKVSLLRPDGREAGADHLLRPGGSASACLDGKAELAEDRLSVVVTERNGTPSAARCSSSSTGAASRWPRSTPGPAGWRTC